MRPRWAYSAYVRVRCTVRSAAAERTSPNRHRVHTHPSSSPAAARARPRYATCCRPACATRRAARLQRSQPANPFDMFDPLGSSSLIVATPLAQQQPIAAQQPFGSGHGALAGASASGNVNNGWMNQTDEFDAKGNPTKKTVATSAAARPAASASESGLGSPLPPPFTLCISLARSLAIYSGQSPRLLPACAGTGLTPCLPPTRPAAMLTRGTASVCGFGRPVSAPKLRACRSRHSRLRLQSSMRRRCRATS